MEQLRCWSHLLRTKFVFLQILIWVTPKTYSVCVPFAKYMWCQSIRYLSDTIIYFFTNLHLINVNFLQIIVQYVLHISQKEFVKLLRILVAVTKFMATTKMSEL